MNNEKAYVLCRELFFMLSKEAKEKLIQLLKELDKS